MSTDKFVLRSFIRGESAQRIGIEAKLTYCLLGAGQPLMLEPEPGNPVDASAVLVRDLYGSPAGYVAREHAPIVAGKIKAGYALMAKTTGPCLCVKRNILIWSDGEPEREVESEFKLPAPKKKNKVLEKIGSIEHGPSWVPDKPRNGND